MMSWFLKFIKLDTYNMYMFLYVHYTSKQNLKVKPNSESIYSENAEFSIPKSKKGGLENFINCSLITSPIDHLSILEVYILWT